MVTLPVQTREFWGFESSQSWDNPVTAQTTFTNVSPGTRTLIDVRVITYFKEVVDLQLRRVAAYDQYSQSVRYYDDAVNAANKGLEYWTNIDLHVNELLNNHLLTKIQQATPLS